MASTSNPASDSLSARGWASKASGLQIRSSFNHWSETRIVVLSDSYLS